nr:ATP-dependent DNA helicase Q-like 4A [Tanacetum cinerariifolium]
MNLPSLPEASNHLQLMNDILISISNDLLDNIDLDPDQTEKPRQDRLLQCSFGKLHSRVISSGVYHVLVAALAILLEVGKICVIWITETLDLIRSPPSM